LAIVASVLLLTAGCAGWKRNLAALTAMPERKEREAEAVRSFEQHRDTAQLQAALDRWHQGDVSGCEARLAALVERRPDFSDARLRLGEALAARGEAAKAEAQFRAVLEREPNRAEAHHAIGLLLDAVGKTEESRQHLARAVELEPENEVYQETRNALR
jgi:Tfp pilus assembly protein PilF